MSQNRQRYSNSVNSSLQSCRTGGWSNHKDNLRRYSQNARIDEFNVDPNFDDFNDFNDFLIRVAACRRDNAGASRPALPNRASSSSDVRTSLRPAVDALNPPHSSPFTVCYKSFRCRFTMESKDTYLFGTVRNSIPRHRSSTNAL